MVTVRDADNALEVDRLSVRLGQATVLSSLSFAVPRKSTLAIIGPNGAGKTVLLKALIGALAYDGEVRWAADTRIGYVPQKLDIERDLPLSGDDLLRAEVAVAGTTLRDAQRAGAVVGLTAAASAQPIGSLSGGQFQRLLVAVALAGRPSVLLLDEPTAGVDEPGQSSLNDALQRLRSERELTTLLISHDLSVVYRVATNVLCLSHGRSFFGRPTAVLTPSHLEELYGAPIGYHVHDELRA
jgi:zinc transport system ATP-binding protein